MPSSILKVSDKFQLLKKACAISVGIVLVITMEERFSEISSE